MIPLGLTLFCFIYACYYYFKNRETPRYLCLTMLAFGLFFLSTSIEGHNKNVGWHYKFNEEVELEQRVRKMKRDIVVGLAAAKSTAPNRKLQELMAELDQMLVTIARHKQVLKKFIRLRGNPIPMVRYPILPKIYWPMVGLTSICLAAFILFQRSRAARKSTWLTGQIH